MSTTSPKKPKKPVSQTKKPSSSISPTTLAPSDVRLEYSVKVLTADGEKITLEGQATAHYALSKASLSNAQSHFNQLFTVLVDQPLKAKYQAMVAEELEKNLPPEEEESTQRLMSPMPHKTLSKITEVVEGEVEDVPPEIKPVE